MLRGSSRYIKKVLVVVDKNPFPPASGKADIALRIRVNIYSYIRAIAETSDGKLYMTKKFVKASGGCSAPIAADLDVAMKRLGTMKFRLDRGIKPSEPALVQLLISHPNISGMQVDQVTWFLEKSPFCRKSTGIL